MKSSNQTYIEQKVERIHSLQKLGLKVLVIVRGLPGSGKSTLARCIFLEALFSILVRRYAVRTSIDGGAFYTKYIVKM